MGDDDVIALLNEHIEDTDWRKAFPHLTASATVEAPRLALASSR